MKVNNRLAVGCVILIALLQGDTRESWAAAPPKKPVQAEASNPKQVIQGGLSFLKSTQQPDGGWMGFGEKTDPAITALVVKCFIQSSQYGPEHPLVARAIDFMLGFAHPDGGIYVEGQGLMNYQTSVCLMALAALSNPDYRHEVKLAQEFLIHLQWDEAEGYEADSPWYGGSGYGRHKRPDLSNTQMMIEALHESGLAADHPVYEKATKFIQRCQMRAQSNDQPFASGTSDGGFIYTPVNGGESKAGLGESGGQARLRTYGSMTYSGFKSLLYANVRRDDPRIKSAYGWICDHYTLDHNPNMPGADSEQGLYYYYHVFAKSMKAWGGAGITDSEGKTHDWRADLTSALAKRQRPDGSFVNQADRWMEGNPYLVTSYAVLALQETPQGR